MRPAQTSIWRASIPFRNAIILSSDLLRQLGDHTIHTSHLRSSTTSCMHSNTSNSRTSIRAVHQILEADVIQASAFQFVISIRRTATVIPSAERNTSCTRKYQQTSRSFSPSRTSRTSPNPSYGSQNIDGVFSVIQLSTFCSSCARHTIHLRSQQVLRARYTRSHNKIH